MSNKLIRFWVSLFALMVVTACSEPPTDTRQDGRSKAAAEQPISEIMADEEAPEISWPGDEWEVSTPEAEGVDGEVIKSVEEDVREGKYGLVDKILLIRHGRLIADLEFENDYVALNAEYKQWDSQYSYDNPEWHPFYKGTELHTLQSTTKSVISAVMGVAVDKGFIEGVDSPAMSFFGAYNPDMSDPRRAAMTLEDMLTMRAGIDWAKEGQTYDDPTHPTVILENSDEWIKYTLSHPMAVDPGTVWDYNDGVSVLIGKVVTEATGQRADEFARENLFEPIGIDEFYWKISPDGEVDSEGGLYLTSYDLARFGYLFLREGMWNGQRVLSEAWIEESVRPRVEDIRPDNDKADSGYGYQWWVPRHENGEAKVYATMGYGGQYALVSPEHDLVAVFNGWNIHGQYNVTLDIFFERFLPAVKN